MTTEADLIINNAVDGSLGFRLSYFSDDSHYKQVQRVGYFSIIWIQEGTGTLKADFSEYDLVENKMLFFIPLQPFSISGSIKGVMMNFHPDFFCIIKHQKEVACDGILFNNLHNPPLLEIPENEVPRFNLLIEQIKQEVQFAGVAQYDLLVSYLKIFLINATRIKVQQTTESDEVSSSSSVNEPGVLQEFKDAIEKHFRSLHSAGDYADLLNITVKTLGRLAKEHFNKTITELIADRIVLEAKRELYLTAKPVKEIAYDLGFNDEYHFSKYFKNWTKASPVLYRSSLKNAWGSSAAAAESVV